jgi:long-chain acyl-CoA synthetase
MVHGAGFLMVLAPLFFGGSVELLPRFDIGRLLGAVAETRATSVYMVPTHFSALFAMGERRHAFDLSSLKTVASGTAPLAQSLKAEIVALFGEGKLYERYGSTEGGIVTALRPEYQLSKIQCVGQPLAATQIAILDQEGRPVKTGEVGELYSCSPYMFSGYLNLPEATDKAMREEWFTAGDMARQDEEGFVYLVDRKNDMIISGGENVYPREVEEVLLSHPAVAEAAVVGLPHPYWGEEVTAYVVLRPGMTASPDDLAGACRAALSRYKTPKAVHLVERLPRNSMGKILRRELRQNQGKQGV